MFIETHILQQFAPSNLNRDDTGAPKDCVFGGYRRARISSQCLKRAMRTVAEERALVASESLAVRTRLLLPELKKGLHARGHDADMAETVARAAVRRAGLGLKEKDRTQYLLFIGNDEIAKLTEVCERNWSDLLASAGDGEGDGKATKGKKEKRKAGDEVAKALTEALRSGTRAVDLALFGRMVADMPETAIGGASQVAHAISTHEVAVEFDFYTAVDDLAPEETAAAGMMGTIEFNSACYYRYANLNVAQLQGNLGGQTELTVDAARAWLQALVAAVPTGKQNSMAAHNPPSVVMAVTRDHGLWSLANAFARPVTAKEARGDLMAASAERMAEHWTKLTGMYGREGVRGAWEASLDHGWLAGIGATHTDVSGLVGAVTGDVASALS